MKWSNTSYANSAEHSFMTKTSCTLTSPGSMSCAIFVRKMEYATSTIEITKAWYVSLSSRLL